MQKTGLFSAVNDEELDRILSEVHRRHPNTGYKLMRGHLNARGVRVPSEYHMGIISIYCSCIYYLNMNYKLVRLAHLKIMIL